MAVAERKSLKGLNPNAAEFLPVNQIITYYALLPPPLVNPNPQPFYFPSNLDHLQQHFSQPPPISTYSSNPFHSFEQPDPPSQNTHEPNPHAVEPPRVFSSRFGHGRRRSGGRRGGGNYRKDTWRQQRREWRPMVGKGSCTTTSTSSSTNNNTDDVVRNLSKNEPSANDDDDDDSVKLLKFRGKKMSKRYSDVLPVVRDGNRTTVMIRNIPNKYNRGLLVEFLDNHCQAENRKSGEEGGDHMTSSAFDFLYLPIDFQTGFNKGYAFVNFTSPEAVWKFYLAAHYHTWDLFQSTKICKIACAKIQGKNELVKHFENMGFPCESEEVLPVCFSPARDGSKKKVEEQITVGRCIGGATGNVFLNGLYLHEDCDHR